MLKKRILASSMASVMALTSISAVAFADDASTEIATKDMLKSYLASSAIKELIDGKIEEYGSVSGANFLKATEFAEKVVNGEYDSDSKENGIDYVTLAYQMVKAEYAKLKQYTKADLQKLLADCKPDYDTENHLNAVNDLIWSEGSWNNFVDAYESADGYKDSDDIRVTTDEYEKLYEAWHKLAKLETVTKKQIEAAKTAYEKAIKLEFKNQPWERGTVNGSGTDYDGKTYSWGALYKTVFNGNTETQKQYDAFDAIKEISESSNPDFVKAAEDMRQAAAILNGFSVNSESGSETKTGSLLRQYHGRLVMGFNRDEAKALLAELATKMGTNTDGKQIVEVLAKKTKYAAASWQEYDSDAAWDTTSGDYVYDGWNYTTDSTHLLSAELKVRIKTGVNSLWAVKTKTKTAAGQGEIIKTSIDGTTYQYLYTTKEDAQKAFEGLEGDFEVHEFKAGSTYTLSDFVAVNVEDIVTEDTDIVADRTLINAYNTAYSTWIYSFANSANAKKALEEEFKKQNNDSASTVLPHTVTSKPATYTLTYNADGTAVIKQTVTDTTAISSGTDAQKTALANAASAYNTSATAYNTAKEAVENAFTAANTDNDAIDGAGVTFTNLSVTVSGTVYTNIKVTAASTINAANGYAITVNAQADGGTAGNVTDADAKAAIIAKLNDDSVSAVLKVTGAKVQALEAANKTLAEKDAVITTATTGTKAKLVAAATDCGLNVTPVTTSTYAVSGDNFVTTTVTDYTSTITGGSSDLKTALTDYNDAAAALGTAKTALTTAKTNLNTGLYADYEAMKAYTHGEKNSVYDGVDTQTWPGDLSLTDSTKTYAWFTRHSGTTYTNSDAADASTAVSLALAFSIYDVYNKNGVENTNNSIGSNGNITETRPVTGGGTRVETMIDYIDNINSVKNDPKRSTVEWKAIYNYLKYALEDIFEGEKGNLKTKKDVDDLVNKSFELTDKTVSASLFNQSHMDVVDERQAARDWSKAADLVDPYVDNQNTALYKHPYGKNPAAYPTEQMIAHDVYGLLETEYNQLADELSHFAYSYEDVAKLLVEGAKAIDETEDPEKKEALQKAVAAVAAGITEVEVVRTTAGDELSDSEAFYADGTFNWHNRLYTTGNDTVLKTGEDDKGDGIKADDKTSLIDSNRDLNWTHGQLLDAYNALNAILKGKMPGDATMDGEVNALDVTAVLKHVARIELLTGQAFENANVTSDTRVDALDATAILKMIAENASKN